MQPGIPTAAQTFPSSQTEIADPTSVDGGAGTSNKGMLLHRREPRNVGPRKKVGWKLEEILVSSNYRTILCFTRGRAGMGKERKKDSFRVEDEKLKLMTR